jgi:hypothetical protein
VRLEVLGKFKKKSASSGLDPVTFQLVATFIQRVEELFVF